MVENTDLAIAKTSSLLNCEVIDYTVAPIFMKEKEKGAHEWMIEFKKQPEDLALFCKTLDETLQSLNSDYEAKRYLNMTLNPLQVNERVLRHPDDGGCALRDGYAQSVLGGIFV